MSDQMSIINIWCSLEEEKEDFYEDNKEEVDAYMEKAGNDLKLACFMYLVSLDVLPEEEAEIVRNGSFMREMLKQHADTNVTLSLALYHSSSILNSEYLHGVESDIIRKYQGGSLLNMTKELGSGICPVIKDGQAYDENGNVIPTDKLFEYKDHCYNIDDLIEESEHRVKLDDEKLYETVLTKHVNISNQHFTDATLNMAIFSELSTSFDMSHNRLMYLRDLKFQDSVKSINLRNNPIVELQCRFGAGLEILDLSNTAIREINSNVIPRTLKVLKLNNCHSLLRIDLTGFDRLEVLEMDNCILVRELVVQIRLKRLIAKFNSLRNIKLVGCTQLEEIVLTNSADENQRIYIQQMDYIPSFYGTSCNVFTIENCETMRSVPSHKVLSETKTLVLKNNTNMVLGKDQIDHLKSLVKLVVESCPKIDKISSGMFSDSVFLNNKRLVVEHHDSIRLSPLSKFEEIKMH